MFVFIYKVRLFIQQMGSPLAQGHACLVNRVLSVLSVMRMLVTRFQGLGKTAGVRDGKRVCRGGHGPEGRKAGARPAGHPLPLHQQPVQSPLSYCGAGSVRAAAAGPHFLGSGGNAAQTAV